MGPPASSLHHSHNDMQYRRPPPIPKLGHCLDDEQAPPHLRKCLPLNSVSECASRIRREESPATSTHQALLVSHPLSFSCPESPYGTSDTECLVCVFRVRYYFVQNSLLVPY